MSDKIEPALSENAWIGGYHGRDVSIVRARDGILGNSRVGLEVRSASIDDPRDFAALIASFNDALDDSDSRKITREKIAMMRRAAWEVPDGWSGNLSLSDFADALESYLPRAPKPDALALPTFSGGKWTAITEPLAHDRMPRAGTREIVGNVIVGCPECGGRVSTELAGYREQITNGLRFVGVPCPTCGKSFTIEMTDDDWNR